VFTGANVWGLMVGWQTKNVNRTKRYMLNYYHIIADPLIFLILTYCLVRPVFGLEP